jgi:uncharacterized membrane protein
MHALLYLHIGSAVVSLLAGFMAMAFRKGSSLHNAAGAVFYVAMLVMTSSAFIVAAFIKPLMLNVVASLLTMYFVVTARRAAKNREGNIAAIDTGAMIFIALVGTMSIVYGLKIASSSARPPAGVGSFIYFAFGTIAIFCARTDRRMLRQGGVVGQQRIARHLWRMSSALLITTLSFYPGQARIFPTSMRTPLLFLPHILIIVSMIYWRLRVRVRKRTPHADDDVLVAPLGAVPTG